MSNKRYGLKEVADVIFYDLVTKKPVLFFDTLKVSSIENESETAEARGGKGNNKLMAWDYGRTANLTMQDALLSDASLRMLAGSQKHDGVINVVGRAEGVAAGTAPALTFTLDASDEGADALVIKNVHIFKVDEDGLMQGDGISLANGDVAGEVFSFDGTTDGIATGDRVVAFYEYEVANEDGALISFSGRDFPSTYKVVGSTVVRGQDGVDRKMQFQVPKAKLQSSFSLTMDVENVSTFDFNLEVLVDTSNKDFKLYDIIRLNQ